MFWVRYRPILSFATPWTQSLYYSPLLYPLGISIPCIFANSLTFPSKNRRHSFVWLKKSVPETVERARISSGRRTPTGFLGRRRDADQSLLPLAAVGPRRSATRGLRACTRVTDCANWQFVWLILKCLDQISLDSLLC